jgi:hypothetical protein
MAKPELEFHDSDFVPWKPVEGEVGGVYEKILSFDPDDGSKTRLLKTEPGVVKTKILVHEYWEEAIVLEGTITDRTLGKTFGKGYYVCRPPGMKHGPFKTDTGSLLFEIHTYKKK